MKRIIFCLYILVLTVDLLSQNPICPVDVYIADPTARVWKDGSLYVYGSNDENLNYWCSHKYDVMLTSDFKTWTVVNDIFFSRGDYDAVSGTDALLFAPDAMFKDGKYYLYFCTPDDRFSEGVAISESPLGPFTNAVRIDTKHYNQIDPTILIDDDGQTYYYWGQKTLKGAKMKPNMIELEESSIKDSILTCDEHFFHEGAFAFKRKGIYYIVFADESRRGKPTCLGYATSSSPLGPFVYRGVIIDNYGCDPNTWNNHGSIVEFNNQWYVFYHRSSHASQVMRKACVEPIFFNEDGTIDEVEMTSQGAGTPLNAFELIEAERACLLKGNCRIEEKNGGMFLSCINDSDCATYKYVDFIKEPSAFIANVRSFNGGIINIRLDSIDGDIIGTLKIDKKTSGEDSVRVRTKVKECKGVHALYLEFVGDYNNMFDIDSFHFE